MRGLTSNDTGRNDSVMLITAKMIKIIFMFIKSENFFGCARKYFLRKCVGFRAFLTRRLSGFEISNYATLIFKKWHVSRHFANISQYLNFSEEYL